MEWINLFFITFHLAFRFTYFQKQVRLANRNDFQKLNSLVLRCFNSYFPTCKFFRSDNVDFSTIYFHTTFISGAVKIKRIV